MPRPRQHSHPMPLALDQTSQLHVRILSKTTHSTMRPASFYFRASRTCSTKTTNIKKGHTANLQYRRHLGFLAMQLPHLRTHMVKFKAQGMSTGLLSTHMPLFVPPQLPGPRKATSRGWPVVTLAYGSYKVYLQLASAKFVLVCLDQMQICSHKSNGTVE